MSKNVCKLWSRSPCQNVEISYSWTIESFSLRSEKVIYSPTFSSPQDDMKREWRLSLYPSGDGDQANKDHLSIFLRLMASQTDEVKVNNCFSIQDENGKCLKSTAMINETFRPNVTTGSWGLGKFCKRDYILPKLPNDVLIVKCEMKYLNIVLDNVSGNVTDADEIQAATALKFNLCDDLGALLTSDDLFSDITICVGNGEAGIVELKAHRAILAVRSPYFAAMLKNDFREKQENRVRIDDVKPDVFRDVMAFIYTGKVPENMGESVAKDILVAADRFALDKLKALAENVLVSKFLTMENALDLLILADIHSAQILKTEARDFVAAHLDKVMETDGWKMLIQGHPHFGHH